MGYISTKSRSHADKPEYPLLQPEIFYKLQPDILAACDEWERSGGGRLTREAVMSMADRVHDSVCAKYPDLAKMAHEYEKNMPAARGELKMHGIKIMQRGIFRDLLAFLLLGELFRRGRRIRR